MRKRTKDDKKYGRKTVQFTEDYEKGLDADSSKWVVLPKWAHQSIVCSHTKRYHNCLYLLAGLGSCARDLMDYITEEMDSDNIICTNEYFRKKFIEFIKNTTKESGEITYGHSTVKRALSILFSKNLIHPIRRGYSKVNPKYFIRNNDSNRMEKIRLQLEFEHGVDTKLKLIQKEVDELNKE